MPEVLDYGAALALVTFLESHTAQEAARAFPQYDDQRLREVSSILLEIGDLTGLKDWLWRRQVFGSALDYNRPRPPIGAGSPHYVREEQSPWQELAIRICEDNPELR